MKLYKLLIILYICFTLQNNNIQNGVYNIINDDIYLSYSRGKVIFSKTYNLNTCFRIRKVSGYLNNTYYHIEDIDSNNKLNFINTRELYLNKIANHLQLWNIIKINNTHFIIKNFIGCFIKIYKQNIICDFSSEFEPAQFNLIKIFSEVEEDKNNTNYTQILNNEPIDILIKYIDLRDSNLKRNGIHQIAKDFDNEELRFSIRGILKNVPWIRKIFILMPNEKVRYFKDYNFIKNKIVYVKDIEFLGYDSSNFNAFLFRYWMMKKYGISDNFIIMDDDYFINKPLLKSDFFYVENGKVIPAIITSNFIKIDPKSVKENYELYEKKINENKEEQGGDEFNYSKFLTFSFILNFFNVSFNDSIFIPRFTHNAIPVNVKDIKEIYDLAYFSKYKYNTLDCLYRISGYLQFQILILSYTFLKYNRKIKNIPNKFVQLNDSISANYRYPLFCINKGAGNFSYLNFYKAKIAMEYLFPIPSPFEIIDYSFIKISFNVAYSMDRELKLFEKNQSFMIDKKEVYTLEICIILCFIFILIRLHYKNIFYNIFGD